MAVLLALGAAIAYGISDFVGGVASRRTSAWPVALVSSGVGGAGALLLVLVLPGDPTAPDLGWGALAGVGSGFGAGFLYHGLSLGRMGVVGPVSAVGAAALPVLVGVVGGERPAPLVWVGIVVALPAIWLVAREPRVPGTRSRRASGLVEGLLAGAGFGLLFSALGQVPDTAGFAPILVSQLVGVVTIALLATALGGSWRPRHTSELVGGTVSGTLAVTAVTGFVLAVQQGLLAVSAVLASLYPAFTVLLASLVLKEPIHRTQGVGLLLSALCVACVALG